MGMTSEVKDFSRALRRLMARPQLRERFMELETTDEVCRELDLTEEMANELKLVMSGFGASVGGESTAAADDNRGASLNALDTRALDQVNSAEDYLNRSFNQLRAGARILMAMSVTLFIIGVGFLVIAAIRAFTHPESAQVTGVIAGIGIVQIVALFYRNPLRDISRSISNAQQAKMIIMSYMLGVGLIGRSLSGRNTESEQESLRVLTRNALEQLESFTEARMEKGQAEALHQAAIQAAGES